MHLDHDNLRLQEFVHLDAPLTRDELIERIYRDGQRIVGRVKVPFEDLAATDGLAGAEAFIAAAFVGDAPIHPGTLRYQPTGPSSDPKKIILVLEVHVDIERLGVDWDRIDDDTPTGDDGQPESRSFHHHTRRPIRWALPTRNQEANDAA